MSNRKSGHKTHTETPSQPITDAELRSDFIKQYQYGFECGRNWAKTASSEAFREALHRKTVKEQMSKYFDLLAEYTEWTREHTEFICGEWETEYSVTPSSSLNKVKSACAWCVMQPTLLCCRSV